MIRQALKDLFGLALIFAVGYLLMSIPTPGPLL